MDYDESGANKQYNEGLVMYAQGKYYDAERLWELSLRLNPNHKKARIALHKLRNLLKE
jgi:tetratricopeptide (TPR) repeat protein